MIDTILFDLDGTLLPMDQASFTKLYFKELTKKCTGYGFEADPLAAAVWAGTKAMVANDGTRTNEAVFWDVFAGHMGSKVLELKPVLEKFYENEFHNARAGTGENLQAQPLIRNLKSAGFTLVLASNPVFPRNAYNTRLSWIGLSVEDFDLVTSYETFHHCKPNPRYYSEILEQVGKPAQNCLMVGNDLVEDGCAERVDIPCYLVTDHLIAPSDSAIEDYTHGSFSDFMQHAKQLSL